MVDSGKTRQASLAAVELPDFGVPVEEPEISEDAYRSRFDKFSETIARSGFDAAVVYADREHSANLSWLTGFDPRFEESLLIVIPDQPPTLLTGPENVGVAAVSPISARILSASRSPCSSPR